MSVGSGAALWLGASLEKGSGETSSPSDSDRQARAVADTRATVVRSVPSARMM